MDPNSQIHRITSTNISLNAAEINSNSEVSAKLHDLSQKINDSSQQSFEDIDDDFDFMSGVELLNSEETLNKQKIATYEKIINDSKSELATIECATSEIDAMTAEIDRILDDPDSLLSHTFMIQTEGRKITGIQNSSTASGYQLDQARVENRLGLIVNNTIHFDRNLANFLNIKHNDLIFHDGIEYKVSILSDDQLDKFNLKISYHIDKKLQQMQLMRNSNPEDKVSDDEHVQVELEKSKLNGGKPIKKPDEYVFIIKRHKFLLVSESELQKLIMGARLEKSRKHEHEEKEVEMDVDKKSLIKANEISKESIKKGLVISEIDKKSKDNEKIDNFIDSHAAGQKNTEQINNKHIVRVIKKKPDR